MEADLKALMVEVVMKTMVEITKDDIKAAVEDNEHSDY